MSTYLRVFSSTVGFSYASSSPAIVDGSNPVAYRNGNFNNADLFNDPILRFKKKVYIFLEKNPQNLLRVDGSFCKYFVLIEFYKPRRVKFQGNAWESIVSGRRAFSRSFFSTPVPHFDLILSFFTAFFFIFFFFSFMLMVMWTVVKSHGYRY